MAWTPLYNFQCNSTLDTSQTLFTGIGHALHKTTHFLYSIIFAENAKSYAVFELIFL